MSGYQVKESLLASEKKNLGILETGGGGRPTMSNDSDRCEHWNTSTPNTPLGEEGCRRLDRVGLVRSVTEEAHYEVEEFFSDQGLRQ